MHFFDRVSAQFSEGRMTASAIHSKLESKRVSFDLEENAIGLRTKEDFQKLVSAFANGIANSCLFELYWWDDPISRTNPFRKWFVFRVIPGCETASKLCPEFEAVRSEYSSVLTDSDYERLASKVARSVRKKIYQKTRETKRQLKIEVFTQIAKGNSYGIIPLIWDRTSPNCCNIL